MMRKTNEGQSPVGILLPSVLAGLLGTLLLMLLGAVLVPRGTLAEGAIAPCALVFLALGSALAALVAAKRAGENQFYWSLGAGFAVFLILLSARLPASPHARPLAPWQTRSASTQSNHA